VLLGNLGDIFGGVEVFPDARPDDGMLELGVCTAEGLAQWTRTLARTAVSDPGKSPFIRVTKARKVKVELDRKVRYELDGGDRSKVQRFKVKVEEGALRVRVPRRDPQER
jgi:diacylglycerol kinase (ATP)